jgi:hypothetical protein
MNMVQKDEKYFADVTRQHRGARVILPAMRYSMGI